MTDPAATSPEFTVLRGHELPPPALRGGAVAIGNFDGVHRGHQAVLARAIAAGRPALALTFEPHPRTFFRPDAPIPRLTPDAEKLRVLRGLRLDGVAVLPFDGAMAGLSADAFVEELLLGRFGARHVVVGYDFHFGANREGSPAFLQAAGQRLGFSTEVVEPQGEERPISSTWLRELLAAGALERANALLGYRFFVTGAVIHGDKRGRLLGYPTANMLLGGRAPLAYGIYAVRMEIEGVVHGGVASYGSRPTFDNGAPRLETFVFDFSGDLYDKVVSVEFIGRIRPEERFESVDALITQMDRDSATARAMISRAEAFPTPRSMLG